MDKLIELLEAFEKENVEKLKSDVWGNDTISPRVWSESDITIYNKLQVISKEYGFIKWLVENDKIDLENFKYNSEYSLKVVSGKSYVDLKANVISETFLLMILSIQDNPIEFLISILK